MRRLPRGDAALHPQGAQGAPFQWPTGEPKSLVEIIFPEQDWIVMVAGSSHSSRGFQFLIVTVQGFHASSEMDSPRR